eukprot:6761072-Pyramimonas_sp.AAC.1
MGRQGCDRTLPTHQPGYSDGPPRGQAHNHAETPFGFGHAGPEAPWPLCGALALPEARRAAAP